MKLSQRRARPSSVELNLTSMIDVIFLLLIFFIVNAGFSQSERFLQSGLKAQAAAGKRANIEPVIVEFVRDEGTFAYKVSARTAANQEGLIAILREIPTKANGAFVKVKDDVSFEMAATAVQSLVDAGFASVTYIPVGGK